jgi:hypothetical protein
MVPVVSVLLYFVVLLFWSQAALRLENLVLWHQVAVYKQTRRRPRLHSSDRLFWVCLSRLWPSWRAALASVQPRTVIAWQRKRFRDHWYRLCQPGKRGRPAIAPDVRELIRTMWQAHPNWEYPSGMLGPCDRGERTASHAYPGQLLGLLPSVSYPSIVGAGLSRAATNPATRAWEGDRRAGSRRAPSPL